MNQLMRPFFFLIFLWFSQLSEIEAQVVYASTFTSQAGQIVEIDLETCATTPLVNVPAGTLDMCNAPNGLIYIIHSAIQIESVDPISGTITPVATLPNIASNGLEWGEDGFLYAITNGIFKINPTTGVVQNMGQFPAGWASTGELVYLNGIYYGAMNTPQGWKLVDVNLADPAASTIITNMPFPFAGGASINHPTCPKLIWFVYDTTPPSEVWEYDVNTQTWEVACGNIPFVIGGGDTPNDYTFPISCPCATDAGILPDYPGQICLPQVAEFSAAILTNLEPDDLLQYILYTDENDPLGSIVAISNIPSFTFGPPLEVNINYFGLAIAGNNLNGNVDLNDPCLDFSTDTLEVEWLPQPTVSFAVANPEVCAGDCLTFDVTFTGTPPFSLTYTAGGGPTQTQIFSANSGTLEVCPPAGTPPGPVTLEAVSLTDANCVCE